jgi:hypothetical protein
VINNEQADQLIDYVFGMLRPPDKELTRTAWRSSLATLDAEVASQALINGAQVWEHFPSWSQFMQEYTDAGLRREETTRHEDIQCRTCLDMGWVLTYLRPGGFEEYGPCPDCETGKKMEGLVYPRGYWQGRDASHVRPVIKPEPSMEVPDWVPRWKKARAAGDMRPFPEQAGVLGHGDRPNKPLSDKQAWVQPEEYAYQGEGHA